MNGSIVLVIVTFSLIGPTLQDIPVQCHEGDGDLNALSASKTTTVNLLNKWGEKNKILTSPKKNINLHPPLLRSVWFGFRPTRLFPTNLARTGSSLFLHDGWSGWRCSRFRKCTSQSYTTVFEDFSNYRTCCRAELVILGISFFRFCFDELGAEKGVSENATHLDA